MEEKKKHGRQFNQKMKPYLVYYYLMRNSDEDHVVKVADIVAYLEQKGISAERRSIYSDIEAINKCLWFLDNEDKEITEAEDDKYYDLSKVIVYNPKGKGYYVRHRKYDESDIRMIAECIYSSRSIPEVQAENLVSIMKEFISKHQSEKIKVDAQVTERIRTLNEDSIFNIDLIREAMSRRIDGEKHTPEKIQFKYLKYKMNTIDEQVERRRGAQYVVSPYKIIIDNGLYYLLAYSDHFKKMRTYRIDRMRDIELLGIERDGEEEFKKIDLTDYNKVNFSMMGGETEFVTMEFTMDLLDTVAEKFGTRHAYKKLDNNWFSISTKVNTNDQFFGWICGFKRKAKIIAPDNVVKDFVSFISAIKERY